MAQTMVRQNLPRIQERIAAAAARAGRRAEEITLIGVSKTHPAIAIQEAYQAGVRHFGENRVQEWEAKRVGTNNLAATWHLIGHLQSNKTARAAKLFHSVDSVDDFSIAQRLDLARAEAGVSGKLRVLIEVQLADEASKSGMPSADVPKAVEKMTELPHLQLAGLMCIPPFLENPESVRPYFRRLKVLRDDLTKSLGIELPVLSMGMSHDFEAAIEEGATEVRVGTALFGAREYPQKQTAGN
jgi:PLP dependent protein